MISFSVLNIDFCFIIAISFGKFFKTCLKMRYLRGFLYSRLVDLGDFLSSDFDDLSAVFNLNKAFRHDFMFNNYINFK